MKKTKKIFAILLALVMTMAMSVATFAATITITNVNEGETYTAYKLFDVTTAGSGENTTYSYSTKDTELVSALKEIGLTFTTSADGATYYVTTDESGSNFVTSDEGTMSAAELAAALNSLVSSQSYEGELGTAYNATVGEEESNVTITVPNPGYYFVTSTMGSLCFLQTSADSVTIAEKNVEPTLEKDADKTTATIGQKVTYTVTITAQDGAVNYVLHDTMTSGLTFNNDVTVKLNDESVNTSNYAVTTDNEDNCTLEVSFTEAFCNSLNANDSIVVTYSATVNANAITVVAENEAYLSYGNNSETTKDIVTTPNYSFDLVKIDKDNKLLDGAKFELYTAQTGGEAIYLVKTAAGYRVAESLSESGATTTIEVTGGKVTIDGLANGTYWLEEIEAPDGYNMLSGRVSITISDSDNSATLTGEGEDTSYVTESGGLAVVNQAGSELPSTGGMGTTVIYILGAALVLGAGIVLVVRRRMSTDR